MEILSFKDCDDQKIEKFPFKGEQRDVIGTSVRWLSKYGDDGSGYPEGRFLSTTVFTTRPCTS